MEMLAFAIPAWYGLAGLIKGRSLWALQAVIPAVVLSAWLSDSWLVTLMVALVASLAVIVSRFSEQYLAGEANQANYFRWLNWTVAMVMLVVVSDHLMVLWFAWVGISLSLHQLLLFYPDRPRAQLAAHKKFVFARFADVSLLTAIGLLFWQYGTFSMHELANLVAANPVTHVAATLMVLAALLKCAQMPFHGWLIQVVEAPTPVSALLHAGVVNLGGFLLLRNAELLQASWIATTVLALVAGLTLVLAAVIATTRISVKVGLAWSTVSQMALMLLQIAAGLYALAALHLLAHSCYKAYSFLNAGSQVKSAVAKQMVTGKASMATTVLGFSAAFSVYLIGTVVLKGSVSITEVAFFALYSAGFAALVQHGQLAKGLALALVLAGVHTALKYSLGWQALPELLALEALFAGLIALMIGFAWTVQFSEQKPVGKRLHQALFAGLYLDEWATRITLALWPAKLGHSKAQQLKSTVNAEVQS